MAISRTEQAQKHHSLEVKKEGNLRREVSPVVSKE